jgi:hypothetical protein
MKASCSRMEREGRGGAVGSLRDHCATEFGFYSKATGSLWRVVNRGCPDLICIFKISPSCSMKDQQKASGVSEVPQVRGNGAPAREGTEVADAGRAEGT